MISLSKAVLVAYPPHKARHISCPVASISCLTARNSAKQLFHYQYTDLHLEEPPARGSRDFLRCRGDAVKWEPRRAGFRAAPVHQRSAHTAVYVKAVARSLVGAGALVWGSPPFLALCSRFPGQQSRKVILAINCTIKLLFLKSSS